MVSRHTVSAPDQGSLRERDIGQGGHAGIQSNTFPSAHVAGAVASALVLVQYLPLVGGVYLVFAASIALGTVHGRYHYTADSVLGAIVGVGSFTVVRWLAS